LYHTTQCDHVTKLYSTNSSHGKVQGTNPQFQLPNMSACSLQMMMRELLMHIKTQCESKMFSASIWMIIH